MPLFHQLLPVRKRSHHWRPSTSRPCSARRSVSPVWRLSRAFARSPRQVPPPPGPLHTLCAPVTRRDPLMRLTAQPTVARSPCLSLYSVFPAW